MARISTLSIEYGYALVAAKLPWMSLTDAGSLLGAAAQNHRALNANQERANLR
jgi:hypothetical protein